MNDMIVHEPPSKLVPVLIGGLAMAATAIIPMVNLINCACCAGIMGGAVLSVYLYKKNFPADMPFTVGDGVAVGALAGIVGSVLTTVITLLQLGLFSADYMVNFESELDEAFDQMEAAGQDPAAIEAAREFITQVATNPGILFLIVFIVAIVIFIGFGALGGVIGGNIFKTKVIQPPPYGASGISQ